MITQDEFLALAIKGKEHMQKIGAAGLARLAVL